MMNDVLLLAVCLIPLLLIMGVYLLRHQRASRHNEQRMQSAIDAGLHEPASLHPLIDASRCIGCGACVAACPEHEVLGLIKSKAALITPGNCIGHGACQKACPVDAISLVFGTATRGVDIPVLNQDFQTSIAGIYIAGELGGMGLIRNAIEQGRQAMAEIQKSLPSQTSASLFDVVIVGAGPAGLSASLAAKAAGLRALTLEQEASLGGTVAHFPRGKLVMTQPATLPLAGKIRSGETSKENLLRLWDSVFNQHPFDIRFKSRVQSIERRGEGFLVETTDGQYACQRVLLAIGRRGSPRKLDIPGEDLPKVIYRLDDAAQFRDQAVMIVGGGDSALEAAMSIAAEPGTQVTLVYRGDGFHRAKAQNRERINKLPSLQRLTILLNTDPVSINATSVVVSTSGNMCTLPNDAVIICAGGDMPSKFLKQIGITVATKYGTN